MKSEKFVVKINNGIGGELSPTGYSKFNERCMKAANGGLGEEVYGLNQAIEHAKEYLAIDDEYKEKRAIENLKVVHVITEEITVYTIQ